MRKDTTETSPADDTEPTPDTTDDTNDEGTDGQLTVSDTVRIGAAPTEVWNTISDPETLTACVPGAESIERVSERKYTLAITRGVSHLTVSLSGEAEFVELNPPDTVVTTATAFDSKTGSEFEILAGMEINETDDGAATLAYTAEVSISGGAATMSPRILRPIVARDIDAYFENIKDEIEST